MYVFMNVSVFVNIFWSGCGCACTGTIMKGS